MPPSIDNNQTTGPREADREPSRPSEPNIVYHAEAPEDDAIPRNESVSTSVTDTDTDLATELEELSRAVDKARQTLHDSLARLNRLTRDASSVGFPPNNQRLEPTPEHIEILGGLLNENRKIVDSSASDFRGIAEYFDRMRLVIVDEEAFIEQLKVLIQVRDELQADEERAGLEEWACSVLADDLRRKL